MRFRGRGGIPGRLALGGANSGDHSFGSHVTQRPRTLYRIGDQVRMQPRAPGRNGTPLLMWGNGCPSSSSHRYIQP